MTRVALQFTILDVFAANVTRTGEFGFIRGVDRFARDVLDLRPEVITQPVFLLWFDGNHGPLLGFSFELGFGALDYGGGKYIGCD